MCVFINCNPQIRSKQGIGFVKCRNIRLHTDRICIHSCKKMIHSCIGCYAHPIDLTCTKPGTFTHLGNHWINGFLDDGILKLLLSTRLLLLNNTVDHIRSKTDLSITWGCLCKDLSCFHIDQYTGYCGCTYINGKSADGHFFIHAINIIYKQITWCCTDYTFHFEMILS